MLSILKQICYKLVQKEIVRFGLVGIFATFVHYGIYILLSVIINYNIAYTIGYGLSFIANFFLCAKFTFNSKPTTKRGIGFTLSHLINYGLQISVLNIAITLGIPQILAPTLVYVICIPVNFILVRLVFKKI